jgi:predicted ATPase
MQIDSIYLDGYKNVRDTRLDFSGNPILLLLAPNNYGKTNLVEGIDECFSFLRTQLQGKAAVDNLRGNLFRFLTRAACFDYDKLTFGVDFTITNGVTRQYKYLVSLKPVCTPNDDGRTAFINDVEIAEEQLDCKQDGETGYKNKFILGLPDSGGNSKVQLADTGWHFLRKASSKNDDFPSSNFRLALFQAANNFHAVDKDDNYPEDLLDLYREVRSVLDALSRSDLGKVITSSETIPEEMKFEKEKDIAEMVAELKARGNIDAFIEHFHQFFQYYNLSLTTEEFPEETFKLTYSRKLCGGQEATVREWLSNLSFGTRRILHILYLLHTNSAAQISMEEIENGLHLSLFWDAVGLFRSIVSGCEPQQRLIVTTHSPSIVDRFEDSLDAVYIGLPSKKDDGYAMFRRLSDDGKKAIGEIISSNTGRPGPGDAIFAYCLMDFNAEIAAENGWFEMKGGKDNG